MVKENASHSHRWQVANLLQALYRAGKATELEIRKLVEKAFQSEVALDYSVLQRLLLRSCADFRNLPPIRDAFDFLQRPREIG